MLKAIIWCAVSSRAQAKDDKASLHEQEREARELCLKEGWQVVDTLIVPGHTRNYIDFYEMADDSKSVGITAFYDLQNHWKRKDFDILIVRDGDRLAREQAPVAFIIGFVIKAGARIYSLQDGWINEQNHRTTGMFIGYRAASEVDQLRVKQKQAKEWRVQQGIYNQGVTPFGFRQIRDERGRLLSSQIDERYRQAFNDVATLLLEHITWVKIETLMYERFGHVNPRTGKPFAKYTFYHWFHNPWVWGHSSRGFKVADSPNGQKSGPWVWDESMDVPVGIIMARNTHSPVFAGDVGERLKAELWRRRLFSGGARPDNPHRYSGLILCSYCGFYMVFSSATRTQEHYACRSKFTARSRPGCPITRSLPEQAVFDWLNERLARMLETGAPDLLARPPELEEVSTMLQSVKSDMIDVNGQITSLIDKQSTAPAVLYNHYDAKLTELADRLSILTHRRTELERRAATVDMPALESALKDLAAYGSLEAFWQQDPLTVNTLLHRLFGKRRMVAKDKKIVGTGDMPAYITHRHGTREKRKVFMDSPE